MALQIRPVENQANAGLSGAVSGAAGGAAGFMEAQAFKQRQELERRQSDAAMRRLTMAERQQELALSRFFEQQKARQQRMDLVDRKQEAAGKAFDAMRAITGRPAPGSAQTAGNLPMEFDAALDQIGQTVRAGGMTLTQAGEAMKLLGTRYEAAIQRVDADALAKSLADEIATGYWSASGALGLESDVDGDGQPDEIADTPALLLQALQDGVPAEQVRLMHQQAKQAIDFEKARIQERVKVAAESEAKVMQDMTIGPVGRRLATERIAAWSRDEYPHTEEGRKLFDRDLNAAMGGLVPVEKNGQRVYMTEAQRDEVAFGLERGDPLKMVDDRSTILSRFLGEFRDDPDLSAEENEARFQQYQKRMDELSGALFGRPEPSPFMAVKDPRAQQNAPGTTTTRPPPLTEQIQNPDAAGSETDTPQAVFQTLLRGRDPKSLSQDEKAEIALELRRRFGPTGGVKTRK